MNRRLVYFLLLVVLSVIVYCPFVDKDFRWTTIPGDNMNITTIREYFDFIGNPGKSTLPIAPHRGQTYLSGPFIFAGAAAHIVYFLVNHEILPRKILSNPDSLFIFTFRWLNVLFYALAVGFAYLCLMRVFRNALISFFLTISIFLFNHFMLANTMMRVEYYLLFSSVFFFYTAFRVLDNPQLKINYVLFGIAFILSASTKLNTPLFLHVPGLAAFLFLVRKDVDRKKLSLLFGTMLLFSILFFIKWWTHPEALFPFFSGIAEEGKTWYALISQLPYFYYHDYCQSAPLELISGDDPGSSLFKCSMKIFSQLVWVVIPLLIWRQRHRMQPKFALLLLIFAIHSVGLIFGPKLLRYGYLIPFYYLMIIGFALAALTEAKRDKLCRVLSFVWIVLPLIFSGQVYAFTLKQSERLNTAFYEITLQPRQWLLDNAKPDSKVAVTALQSVPLTYDSVDLSPDFLLIPWGEEDKIIEKIPPEKKNLDTLTDVILMSDFDAQGRVYLIENLVKSKYALKQDSLKFVRFTSNLAGISPGIINRLSQLLGEPFSEQAFMTGLLSAMWLRDISIEQALNQYFCEATGDDTVSKKIIEQTATDLMNSDSKMLSLGYSEFIHSSGKMTYAYAWKQFYRDAYTAYKSVHFESPYKYESEKWRKIIVINKNCLREKRADLMGYARQL